MVSASGRQKTKISIHPYGLHFSLQIYDSDNCPLPSGRVKLNELGWVASILGIGGLAGTVAAGWMAERFGRKYSMLSIAAPEVVSFHLKTKKASFSSSILSF